MGWASCQLQVCWRIGGLLLHACVSLVCVLLYVGAFLMLPMFEIHLRLLDCWVRGTMDAAAMHHRHSCVAQQFGVADQA